MLINYGLIFLGALLVYGISCAPGYLWQDSGLIQYRTASGDIIGPFGLALSHPLYYSLTIAVAKCIPWAFPACVNLLSALFAAIAVANLYLLVRIWTNSVFAGLIAALSLAFSHTFWRNACIAETYSLWVCLFTFELLSLLLYHRLENVKWLLCLAAFNGIATSTHILSIIPLTCYLGLIATQVVHKKIKYKTLISILICWLVANSLYLGLFTFQLFTSGDFLETSTSAFFGTQWQDEVLSYQLTSHLLKTSLLYFIMNFPTLNIALLVLPVIFYISNKIPKNSFDRMLWVLMGLFFLFALRYDVPDRYVFFTPFYLLISIYLGLGAHLASQTIRFRYLRVFLVLFTLLPISGYAMVPTAAQKSQYNLNTRGDIPYRDDYTYFLQPWKTGYHGAERFAREALSDIPPNSMICADMTTISPLLLMQQHQGLRPDVQIVNPVLGLKIDWESSAQVDNLLREHSLYVVSRKPGYCPKPLLAYPMENQGVLWRVLPQTPPDLQINRY